jgi:hypothetical protein
VSFNGGVGTLGKTVGGNQISFGNTYITRVAAELAADERYHVALLQNTIALLGGTPIAKPAINLNAAGFGYTGITDFLRLARIFEEIGVSAYGGAAPLISNKTVLAYAARILATEAEHVGFIRALIAQFGVTTSAIDAADAVPYPSGGQFFSTNSNAVTAVRTPGQVLYLAYGNTASATSGGFFPNGVNYSNSALSSASAASAATDSGVDFTITPDPATGTAGLAVVTISWYAPAATYVEVRIGSPTGTLFVVGTSSGSATTGAWVTDGMLFYLQNLTSTSSSVLTANNTLAVAIAVVN